MTAYTLTFLRSAALALAVGGSLACASTEAGNVMLREAEFGSRTEIIDPEGEFQSALSLPFSTDKTAEGDFRLKIPMAGSGQPMYCFILSHETEIGVSALRIAQTIFNNLEEGGVEISDRKIVGIGAGAIDDVAYQSISMTFMAEGEGGIGIGLMKAASANKQGHAIACNHWNAGYAKTFDRAFAELVRSFHRIEFGVDPYYKEVAVIRIGDLTVGVLTTTFTRDSEGDIQGIAEGSTLIPRSENEFIASYSKTIDWSTQNGDLINAFEFDSDVDQTQTNLALKWDQERGWLVTGVYKGKEIEARLDHEERIDSMLSDGLAAKYVLIPGGDHPSTTLMRWIPDADPTKVIDVPMTVDSEDARYFTTRLGELEMRVSRDADGLPEIGTMKVGSGTMTIERIYQDGEF